jgi:hypothetical protein
VRLHQPHPFFTAADIKWTLGADRAHLATKDEVLDHFSHCVNVVKERVRLDAWLGTELLSYEAYRHILNYTQWVGYDTTPMLTVEQAPPHIADLFLTCNSVSADVPRCVPAASRRGRYPAGERERTV